MLDNAIDILCKGSPYLNKLWFADSGIGPSDAAVKSIVQYCPHIESLSLNDWPNVTDLSIGYLTQLSNLKEIDLSHCTKLTSGAVQNLLLQSNRKLESLVLSDICLHGEEIDAVCIIDDALLRCIGLHCPNVIKLHLNMDPEAGSPDATAASFESMIKGLPALEDLQISNHSDSNTILSMLGLYCPRLKHVHIVDVACTNDDFVSMCQGCPLIESLHLGDIYALTDVSIQSLAYNCHSLNKLHISNNDKLTDDSMCTLFTACTHLTSVELSGLRHITDKTILTLIKNHPQLRTLNLYNARLTDHCILALAIHCPYIEHIELRKIKNLSVETIIQISRYCKHIHTIKLDSCIKCHDNAAIIEILRNCNNLIKFCIHITTAATNIQHLSDELQECISDVGSKRYKRLRLKYRDNVLYGV